MNIKLEGQLGRSYFVPCVLRAVEILDALRHTKTGLRVEDLRSATQGSRSTVYRIVRTLLHSGYISRDDQGCYHLNSSVMQFAHNHLSEGAILQRNGRSDVILGGSEESELWEVRFRADAKPPNPATTIPHPAQSL
jgi:hypothetical protein